jgi:hypothetical protein
MYRLGDYPKMNKIAASYVFPFNSIKLAKGNIVLVYMASSSMHSIMKS